MSRAALAPLLEHPLVRALAGAVAGRPAHLVGGVVRDRLLGRRGPDFDAVVAGEGEAVARRLAATLPARLVLLGGDRFAAYRLVGDGYTLDLWDRGEQSLAADLARRDLTINAIAVDAASGELHDPHGGVADLEARRLRAVTPGTFADDPLRVARLVRFGGALSGFAPDADTVAWARAAVPGIARVAPERIRDELDRILSGERFEVCFELLARLDLHPRLWGGAGAAGGDGGVAGRLASVEARRRRLEPSWPVARRELRHAVLCGAPAAAPGEAARRLAGLREAGHASRATAELALRLAGGVSPPAGEAAARRFLNRWGDAWPTAAALLTPLAPADPEPGWWRQVERLGRLAEALGDQLFAPRPLVDGARVQELLGIGPGPRIGEVLDRLLRAQIEGRIGSRSEAEAFVRRLAGGAG